MGRLWAAGAPVGIGGDAVGQDPGRASRDLLPVVSSAREQAGAGLEGAERAHVRTRVEVLGHLHSQQRAVLLAGHLDVEDLAPSVGHGLEALGAGLGPLDRTVEKLRGRRDEVVLGVRADLGAEAPSDIR